MNFFCIADKESSLGFKLVGIETAEVITKKEAQEALRVARETEDVGIILITSKIASLIRDKIEEFIFTHQFPLILEIPSRDETGESKNANDFLKEVLGIYI